MGKFVLKSVFVAGCALLSIPAAVASLGAQCQCYCCPGQLGGTCDPVMVGTVPLGIGDTAASCSEQACAQEFKQWCPATNDTDSNGQNIPVYFGDDVVNGDVCAQASACSNLQVGSAQKHATFDLAQLCTTQGYEHVDAVDNSWSRINICGFTSKICVPANCAEDTSVSHTHRNFSGPPCTPWTPTSNVGSAVRFYQTNLDPPPAPGGHYPEGIQQSCFTGNGDDYACTPACSIISSSISTPDIGIANNQYEFIDPKSATSGIRITMPSVMMSQDDANPLKGFCQQKGAFIAGVQTLSIELTCNSELKSDFASIMDVRVVGCDTTVLMETGAVCQPFCESGSALCGTDNKDYAGFCRPECVPGLGAGWVIIIILLSGFALYCIAGICVNRCYRGEFQLPQHQLWMSCLACKCCSSGSDGSGAKGTSGYGQMSGGGNDFRRASYGTHS